jgi:hypothetical protein
MRFVLCLILATMFIGNAPYRPDKKGTSGVKEIKVDQMPRDLDVPTQDLRSQFEFSSDLTSVAFIGRDKKGFVLVSGARRSQHLENLDGILYAPVGNLVVASSRRGKQVAHMIDFQAGEFFQYDDWPDRLIPRFSKDGKFATYTMDKQDKAAPTLNGKVVAWYDGVRDVGFNPRTNELAYLAKIDTRWYFMEGSLRIPLNYDAFELTFDETGRHRVIFGTEKSGYKSQYLVDLDGVVQQGRYDAVGYRAFDPLAGTFAFEAQRGLNSYVVLQNSEAGPYELIFGLRFSPDGRRLVYPAYRDGKYLIVVGDREFQTEAPVGRYAMSPDGESVAYLTKNRLFVNERLVAKYSDSGPAPSDWFPLVFSPNGRMLAYFVIGTKDQQAVVHDLDQDSTITSPAYDGVRDVRFSSDGTTLMFGARRGRDFLRVELTLR